MGYLQEYAQIVTEKEYIRELPNLAEIKKEEYYINIPNIFRDFHIKSSAKK